MERRAIEQKRIDRKMKHTLLLGVQYTIKSPSLSAVKSAAFFERGRSARSTTQNWFFTKPSLSVINLHKVKQWSLEKWDTISKDISVLGDPCPTYITKFNFRFFLYVNLVMMPAKSFHPHRNPFMRSSLQIAVKKSRHTTVLCIVDMLSNMLSVLRCSCNVCRLLAILKVHISFWTTNQCLKKQCVSGIDGPMHQNLKSFNNSLTM